MIRGSIPCDLNVLIKTTHRFGISQIKPRFYIGLEKSFLTACKTVVCHKRAVLEHITN